jgi:hypothetical protein
LPAESLVATGALLASIGTPKSGKPREIPLGVEVRAALKEHRHLRGPLVLCNMSGELLGTVDTRLPLWRAFRVAPPDARGRAGTGRRWAEFGQSDGAENEKGSRRCLLGGGDKGDRILPDDQ